MHVCKIYKICRSLLFGLCVMFISVVWHWELGILYVYVMRIANTYDQCVDLLGIFLYPRHWHTNEAPGRRAVKGHQTPELFNCHKSMKFCVLIAFYCYNHIRNVDT